MHGSFFNSLKPNTNHMLLNMIIFYYQKVIEDNKKLRAKDWKLQMNKEEWKEFYSTLVNGLQKRGIEECKDENGKVIGIRRPGGLGIQAVRIDFEIKNTEFLKKADRIIKTSPGIWGIGIDLGVNGLQENGEIWSKRVKAILFCNVDKDKRKKFHDFAKSKIEKGEIEVVGTRPMFAKIEIDDIGQDKKKIAEIIIEKVYKLYDEVTRCLDIY